MRNITHADLIKHLFKMAYDPINTKDDDGATKSMTHELVVKLIRACNAKFEEIEVFHAKSTNCSNKKGWRVSSKSKLKKSKETKPKGLAHSDSASMPAAVKLESPSHDKAKLGSPLTAKPLSRFNSTSKPKSRMTVTTLMTSSSAASSLKTGKKLPSAIKPTPKSNPSLKLPLKRKNPKLYDSEEKFEVKAALPTIDEAHTHHQAIPKANYVDTIVLSSKEEEP
ncbi:hypothetical protein L0F63_005788, partial [Massospora cicadina]